MAKHTLKPADFDRLVDLAPELTQTLATVAGDVALLLDADGVVRQVAFNGSAPAVAADAGEWVGRSWAETVTAGTREKVEQLLREVAATGFSRSRQLLHPSVSGAEVPITYSAMRLGEGGRVLVVGRDQRAVTAIQQQLVETQQTMERDYWQMRQAETRYRLLFQIATDAVLVVDAATMRILDANRAAGALFGADPEKLVGRPAAAGIDPVSQPTVDELLNAARVTGRAAEVRVQLSDGRSEARVSATPFRSEAATMLLMRVRAVEGAGEAGGTGSLHANLVEHTPEAIVFTDMDGTVLGANPAFLDLVQIANEEGARGRMLGEWIGRPGSDLPIVFALLRKNGIVRLLATSARGEHGDATEVELSASLLSDAGRECVGFVMRGVERRIAGNAQGSLDLASAVERLTAEIGRVSLPSLVQDTTDLVERHFIAAALDLSNNNRTAAAEILGLSRQSLYVKLRRHKLDTDKKSGE